MPKVHAVSLVRTRINILIFHTDSYKKNTYIKYILLCVCVYLYTYIVFYS